MVRLTPLKGLRVIRKPSLGPIQYDQARIMALLLEDQESHLRDRGIVA